MTVYKKNFKDSKEYLLVYCELIKAAQTRRTLGYQDIATIMGLPMTGNWMARQTGQMLGEISQNENDQRRPMLSALVIRTDGSPGDGFFNLARDLGKLTSDAREDEKQFWNFEVESVFRTWQNTKKAT